LISVSKLSTDILADLMVKRRKCLTQLRDLGVRQLQLVAAGEISNLLRVAGAKQQLIVALQALEKQLTPFHEQDPESRAWASPEARARCASDAETCRQLIQEVMVMEQDGERQMTARRDQVAGQLRSVATGGRVREAYGANR
jgi:hypothetical protein